MDLQRFLNECCDGDVDLALVAIPAARDDGPDALEMALRLASKFRRRCRATAWGRG